MVVGVCFTSRQHKCPVWGPNPVTEVGPTCSLTTTQWREVPGLYCVILDALLIGHLLYTVLIIVSGQINQPENKYKLNKRH